MRDWESILVLAMIALAFIGIITALIVSTLHQKEEPYVIYELSEGSRIECRRALETSCGMFFTNCIDGNTYTCMTNVKTIGANNE